MGAGNRSAVDAYIRGYREAIKLSVDWILEIDAGFSHQPEDIPQFFAHMDEGYDLYFWQPLYEGRKDHPGKHQALPRKSPGHNAVELAPGHRLADMTSGFELFSRMALEHVLDRGIRSRRALLSNRNKVYCRNLKIREVPSTTSLPARE